MLEKLAKILLEKESIDGEELKKFWDEVTAGIAEKDSKQVPALAVLKVILTARLRDIIRAKSLILSG